MNQPNILLYFSDQQRADTIGAYGQPLDITPNLDQLSKEGVLFEQAYTAQPVCGPCRALFQSGQYPTTINCFRNNQALPLDCKTVADYFYELGYDCGYVGKWHLASDGDLERTPRINYQRSAIPPERRGGYKGFWRVSDVLEFTSHGYGGYVFDENMNKCEFTGYRVDCITDYALEYLDKRPKNQPFFLTVSHIEPHHQNDHKCYEGPNGSKTRFKDYILPGDLAALHGNADEMYPDYLGCCRSLDDNLGRLIQKLKDQGIYENTVIIYVSDHGSHFMTRNKDQHLNGYDDYKRSCHSACLHVPLVIAGPGFTGGRRVRDLVSTASLPKTLVAIAGLDVKDKMIGEDLKQVADHKLPERKNYVYAQISESRVGRCIHTEDYLYSVYAPGLNGGAIGYSEEYEDDFLYDLKKDPYELKNLINDPSYDDVKEHMTKLLLDEIVEAGEKKPIIKHLL